MFKLELSPVENILALLAKANNGYYIDPRSVSIVRSITFRTNDTDRLTTILVTDPRNRTRTKFDIRHNRLSVNQLLPDVLEVPPNGQHNTSELLRDVVAKYGISLTDDDIVIKKINTDEVTNIEILPDHPTWYGTLDVRVVEATDSLLSMVTQLDLKFDQDEDDLKRDARLLYYGYDFTELSRLLRELAVGESLDAETRRTLNMVVPHKWVNYNSNRQYNLGGSQVTYNGPTDGYDGRCNNKYANIMVLKLGSKCTNLKGDLHFHYN